MLENVKTIFEVPEEIWEKPWFFEILEEIMYSRRRYPQGRFKVVQSWPWTCGSDIRGRSETKEDIKAMDFLLLVEKKKMGNKKKRDSETPLK